MKKQVKEMVRYGRNKNNNRNGVLLTFREGDKVFFGVSRCCDNDTFNRERGLEMARGRAMKAFTTTLDPQGGLEQLNRRFDDGESVIGLTRQTVMGFVKVENVPMLLDWFRGLSK